MIKYYARIRKNPKTLKEAFYAAIACGEIVTLKQLSKRISNACTVNPVDVKAVLAALEQVVIEAISAGDSIRLGELGMIRPTITSSASERIEDVSADNIKKVNVRFLPSAFIKRELNNGGVTFTKHKNYTGKDDSNA